MNEVTTEVLIHLVLPIGLAVMGAIGGLLFFVLKGIRENQTRIWDWAIAEVKSLHTEMRVANTRIAADNMDTKQWVRHEFRTMYQTIIVLSKLIGTADSKELEKDINVHLTKGDL